MANNPQNIPRNGRPVVVPRPQSSRPIAPRVSRPSASPSPTPSAPAPATRPIVSGRPVVRPIVRPGAPQRQASIPQMQAFRQYEVHQDGIDDSIREATSLTQSRYICAASGEGNAVLPSVIWHQTVSAVSQLSERVGDIDTFVCREMDWSADHLRKVLSPEQVDALALIIDSFKSENRSERDFLLADEAGFGKGRILMCAALWCVNRDITPVVFTKNDNLFSNLWQDAIDIGATETFQRPFIINEGVKIDNLSGNEPFFKNISPKLHKETIKNTDTIPDGFKLIMSTWSQLSVKGSAKTAYLKRVMENTKAVFIGDESHISASMSATVSQAAAELRRLSYSVNDTSATSARHLENMRSYRNIYPWLRDMGRDISALQDKYRTWLAEFSVSMAIERGNSIRRELDTSQISLDVVMPKLEDIRKNERLQDRLAEVLSDMKNISEMVQNVCVKKDMEQAQHGDKEVKERVPTNFFSRLHLISGQFDGCIIADLAAEQAIEMLEKNIKPFVIMDMTMEAALNAIIGDNDNDDDRNTFNTSDTGEEINREEDETLDIARKALSLDDVLKTLLDRILVYRQGTDKYVIDKDEFPDIRAAYQETILKIRDLSDLMASPIDYIKKRVEEEGRKRYEQGLIDRPWTMGELSGRSLELDDNGHYRRRSEGRNEVISKFNRDEYDGIISTSTGSTGASMHHKYIEPGPGKYRGDRPRGQIEAVGCRNPTERKQMWGRIYRRGNISTPYYKTLCSGTAYGLCSMALENAKAMRLNASVSGDRNNGMLVDYTHDILSSSANTLAREFLIHHPDIARHLNISVDAEYAKNDDTFFIRKLLGRSMILPGHVVSNIMNYLNAGLQRQNKYASNIEVNDIGTGWSYQSEMLILEPGVSPELSRRSLYQDDMGLIKINREVPYKGMTESQLPPLANEFPILKHLNTMKADLPAHLQTYKPSWAQSVSHALAVVNSQKPLYPSIRRNPCVIEKERYDAMQTVAGQLRVGESFILPDRFGEDRPAIITDIDIPDSPLDWGSYTITYVVPGDEREYITDIKPFLDGETSYIRKNEVARSRFQPGETGMVTETMTLMVGNIPRAVMMAGRNRIGHKVRYTDILNRERDGIIVTKKEVELLRNAPIMVPGPVTAYRLMRDKNVTLTSEDIRLSYQKLRDIVTVSIPKKARSKKIYEKIAVILAGITGQAASSEQFTLNDQNKGEGLEKLFAAFNFTCKADVRENIMAITRSPEMYLDAQATPEAEVRPNDEVNPTVPTSREVRNPVRVAGQMTLGI